MIRPAIVLAISLLATTAAAVDTGQRFEDAAEQARYERLIHDLRCLVCRSESIADSNATLAADLRREVERLIREGKSDSEIDEYMTARYGDFVLMRPPVAARTWLLWAGPALFLAGGLAIVAVVVRRRSRAADANPATLDEEPDAT
jgi:cytochrome c-type biogenesis protein CcmH